MILWLLLFLTFVVIFGAGVLIWWRAENTRRNQRTLQSIRAGAAPETARVRASVLMAAKPSRTGFLSLFGKARGRKPETETADTNPGVLNHARFALAAGAAAFAGLLAGTRFTPVFGPAAPFMGAACGAALPFLWRARKQKQRLTALEEQFPEALDFLARSVRAGNAFSIGLELLAGETSEPLKAEVLKLTRELALGARLEDALNGLIARAPLVEMRFFASAVLLQRETGGNLSEVLGKLAVSLRERLRLRGQVKAASGQGRLTASVLTVLPLATMGLMKFMSPGYMNAMTDDPTGRNLLAGAAVSQLIGYLLMKKITNIEV